MGNHRAVADDDTICCKSITNRNAEEVPDEDPAELIRETIDIERDIVKGLESLLLEVGDLK